MPLHAFIFNYEYLHTVILAVQNERMCVWGDLIREHQHLVNYSHTPGAAEVLVLCQRIAQKYESL